MSNWIHDWVFLPIASALTIKSGRIILNMFLFRLVILLMIDLLVLSSSRFSASAVGWTFGFLTCAGFFGVFCSFSLLDFALLSSHDVLAAANDHKVTQKLLLLSEPLFSLYFIAFTKKTVRFSKTVPNLLKLENMINELFKCLGVIDISLLFRVSSGVREQFFHRFAIRVFQQAILDVFRRLH